MSKFIKSLDFVGIRPSLYIDGNSSFKTVSGGILTILCALSTFGLVCYFAYGTLSRANKNINHSQVLDENPWLSNFEKFPVAILLTNGQGVPIEPEGIVNVEFNHYWVNKELVQDYTTLKDVRCDINKHFGSFKEKFSKIKHLEKYSCPEYPKNFNSSMYGLYGGKNEWKSYMIRYKVCLDKTSSNRPCKPISEIQKILSYAYMEFVYINHFVDNSAINDPVPSYLSKVRIPIDFNTYKRYFFNLDIIKYSTDFGIVFEDFLEVKDKYIIPRYELNPQLRFAENPRLIAVDFHLSNINHIYIRTLEKAQVTIAKIGGIIKAITFLTKFLSYILNENKFFNHINCNLKTSSFEDIKKEIQKDDKLSQNISAIDKSCAGDNKTKLNYIDPSFVSNNYVVGKSNAAHLQKFHVNKSSENSENSMSIWKSFKLLFPCNSNYTDFNLMKTKITQKLNVEHLLLKLKDLDNLEKKIELMPKELFSNQ